MNLIPQIEALKRRLLATKPRSNLRAKLEAQLRILICRQLKAENREDRKAA